MDPNRPMTADQAALEAAKLQKPPHDPATDERQIIADALRSDGEAAGQSEQARDAADAIQSDDPADAPEDDSAQSMHSGSGDVSVDVSTIGDSLKESSPADAPQLPDVVDSPAGVHEDPVDDPFDAAESAPLRDIDAAKLAFDDASALLTATEGSTTTSTDAVGWPGVPEVIQPPVQRLRTSQPSVDPFVVDVPGHQSAEGLLDPRSLERQMRPRTSAHEQGAFRDLLMRSDDPPGTIERGPYILGQKTDIPTIQLLSSDVAPPEPELSVPAAREPVDSPETPYAQQPPTSLPLGLPVMLRDADRFVHPVMDAIAALMEKVADERAEYQIYRRERHKEAELRAIYGPNWLHD